MRIIGTNQLFRYPLLLVFVAALLGNCVPDGCDSGDPAPGPGPTTPTTPPVFQVCDSAPRPTGLATASWNNPLNGLLAATGDWHSAQDVITVAGLPVDVVGKFSYGAVSKDLEGERVEVWIDRCHGGYDWLGEARTDADGRIALNVSGGNLPPVGRYNLYLRVMGDNTYTYSTLRVLLPGTKVVVMDIDGTLTTDDMELINDVFAELFEPLGASYVPSARASAVDLTDVRRHTQGYQLVYLTGRPYWLTEISREWLADLGFAPGSLHTTNSNGEVLPTDSAVGDYKAAYLAKLQGLGLQVSYAYGNASTDIYAYEQAGINKGSTYIVGTNGGDQGTVDLGDDYATHVPAIAGDPPAAQPFTY